MNPSATATDDHISEVVIHALAHELECEAIVTQHAGHARELAARARQDRLDAVVTLGGDGTINEVVNGLLEAGPGPDVPVLATVPGGSANVLPRALGIPTDQVSATASIISGLEEGRTTTIGLGRAWLGDQWRYFVINLGMGLDAEIIVAMDEKRAAGKAATPIRYFATTLGQYFIGTDRRNPAITISLSPEVLDRADESSSTHVEVDADGYGFVDHVFLAIIQNAAPWTYLGPRAVNPVPSTTFDTGLGVFAIRKLSIPRSLRWARRMVAGSPAGSTNGLYVGNDLASFSIIADPPQQLQMDGEGLGRFTRLQVESVPRVLRVVTG